MRHLPAKPVFDRYDARAAGLSDSALSRAVAAGRVVRVRRGLFAAPGSLTPQIAALAAAAGLSGAVVSHRSALLLHDLPVVGHPPPLPEVTVVPSGRGSAHATLLHRSSLPADHVVTVHGVAVTSVARTLVDVARARPVTTAVAALDCALHRRLVTYADLDAVLLRCWNWPGIRRAHRAIGLSDGRAESPLESVSRLVIGWLRLPVPTLQPLVLDPFGVPIARLDFYWEEFGAAGEADGRSKYSDRDVLTAEKDRQEAAEDLHIPFARWGWQIASRQPQRLRAKIESALARGAARDRSGLPRQWSIRPSEPVGGEEELIDRRARAARPRACP